MSETVIKVDNLSKKYILRHAQTGRYTALRDVITHGAKAFGKKIFSPFTLHPSQASQEEFYALKDINFEIKQGDRIGLIGRNGAGKSTLLKILSRITEPTTGRIEIEGRVASLLEVGTGFHPELTGRENIFLNGAILGMTKIEIKRKFDEIVAFAEIEKFLDTPIKRYSSGMYVRLAFAVAAHLEPDILIVDEVLAVGDAQFQKKCLGKMEDVGKEGRTVLFVSHNMSAVLSLCNNAILLDNGKLLDQKASSLVVNRYLSSRIQQNTICSLVNLRRHDGLRAKALLTDVRLINMDTVDAWKLPFGKDIALEIRVHIMEDLSFLELGLALKTITGFEIASSLSSNKLTNSSFKSGIYNFKVHYHNLFLTPGIFRFGLGLRSDRGFEDYLSEAFEIEILDSEQSAELNVHKVMGVVIPEVSFEVLDDIIVTA